MSKLKDIFMSCLDKGNWHYVDVDPEAEYSRVMTMSFQLEEQPGKVEYWIFFDEEDHDGVQFRCNLTRVPEAKLADCYALCNELNCSYRYIKTFVDEDCDFHVVLDDYADENCVIQQMLYDLQLLNHVIPTLVYPKLMKTIWA